jgi:UDP-2-acetamido-3-amino-2,3-dideoxy-glucuronate N-acetyltransferase
VNYFQHETAVVDEGAEIGERSRIWHFVHVSSGARIGLEVVLGQNVFVAGGAVIGDRCKIQNNVSIYDGVILEEEVFCGPSMVFTNVANPRAAIERKSEFRPTRVGRGATLGANCTIVCGSAIGSYAFVGAGAVVTHDVKDFALVTGVPARQVGWMSRNGERLDLPLNLDGEARCPATGERYVVENGLCRSAG